MAQAVNEAVERAHREGILTAASLMVSGAAAAQAIAIAKRLPMLRVGLHLVLVDGVPASPPEDIPDLVDGNGRLKAAKVSAAIGHAISRRIRDQFAREIDAQFAAFRKTGLALDHVNGHEHFHVHPGLGHQVVEIGRRYGMKALRVPREPAAVLASVERVKTPISVRVMGPWCKRLERRARAAGICTPDAVFGLRWSGHMTTERIEGLLRSLPPGLVEIYTHPATDDRFDGHAPGYGYRAELSALTDPAVIRQAARLDRPRGGYSDFADLRALQTA